MRPPFGDATIMAESVSIAATVDEVRDKFLKRVEINFIHFPRRFRAIRRRT
jgi:hypothetical protein